MNLGTKWGELIINIISLRKNAFDLVLPHADGEPGLLKHGVGDAALI